MVRRMPTDPPQRMQDLVDRSALLRHRARAARDPALFLHEDVCLDAQERLAEVNRSFTNPAVITPFAQVWRDVLPGAAMADDAELLDLAPGAHDLVIHALCLHWANDPVGQLVQCRRALAPDGLLLAYLFGGATLQALRTCLAEAEVAETGGLSPRVLPMGDIRDLGVLLQRAGLALPVADSWMRRVEYASPFSLMADLRAMGETNALSGRLRHPTRRSVLAGAAGLYAERCATAGGRVVATFEIVALTGWAPADSQPKPLKPGSALKSLAEALNTCESPLHPDDRNG